VVVQSSLRDRHGASTGRRPLPFLPLGSASGEFLELLERLGIEERPACHLASATHLGTDGAVTVMLGVARALIGAE
jgi:hypothetical protein